ncbi:hypothetical protein [Virgisporangium aurantiacum]|uniref:hypothetical protein n=1 Tax=Virgisporangium aurantiacum TaxID=175570 RepID=UPI004032A07A
MGQVVELTDPELSDEWVVVRFGRDELPFSPTDLQIPAKSTRAPVRAAPAAPASPVVPPVPEPAFEYAAGPAPVSASVPGPREEPPVPTTTTVNGAGRPAKGAKAAPAPVDAADGKASDSPAPAAKKAAEPAAKADTAKVDAGKVDAAKADTGAAGDSPASPAESPAAAPAPKPAARKAAKPKAPPSLTVTLTYAEGEWMVGATQGSKALAKPYIIKPAEALKMVSMLDVPGVHDAVDEIVSAARAEAEQQAEKLRAELAEIESRLAELREAG